MNKTTFLSSVPAFLGSTLAFLGSTIKSAHVLLPAAAALLLPGLVIAEEAAVAPPVLNKGDIAWMLTSTLLVLMMALPGLALFYGGMVRSKNML